MKTNRRNLLWYFLKSKHWTIYMQTKTVNTAYQSMHDPERYLRLLRQGNQNPTLGPVRQGVLIKDVIYDMFDAAYEARIAVATYNRISEEICDLLAYHEEMKTDDEVV